VSILAATQSHATPPNLIHSESSPISHLIQSGLLHTFAVAAACKQSSRSTRSSLVMLSKTPKQSKSVRIRDISGAPRPLHSARAHLTTSLLASAKKVSSSGDSTSKLKKQGSARSNKAEKEKEAQAPTQKQLRGVRTSIPPISTRCFQLGDLVRTGTSAKTGRHLCAHKMQPSKPM
jgi:hypothetical protein